MAHPHLHLHMYLYLDLQSVRLSLEPDESGAEQTNSRKRARNLPLFHLSVDLSFAPKPAYLIEVEAASGAPPTVEIAKAAAAHVFNKTIINHPALDVA